MRELRFEKGKFILYNYLGEAFMPVKSEIDFSEAKRFRHIADDKAKKIIDRIFIRHYAVPSLASSSAQSQYWNDLDPHQQSGVEWILGRSRSYLNHAPGAGKTATAIVAHEMISNPERRQMLAIVPPTLTENWKHEILKWSTYVPTISILPESCYSWEFDWNADYLIVPNSMLSKQWVLDALKKLKPNIVAVDEADQFKEATAQRTIALFGGKLKHGGASPGLVQRARHVVLMSGSPMPNRATELWAPIYAMAPEIIDFMSFEQFGFKFGAPRTNDFGRWEFPGTHNEKELNKLLTDDFMHIVTENELDHAKRLRSMLYMPDVAGGAERKKWEAKNLKSINFSDISEDMSKGALAQFRREIGLKKISFITEYVDYRIRVKGERVLLFAWHQDVLEKLAHNLRKHRPGLIMGGVDKTIREKHKADFQNGKIDLLMGNIKAMGYGHNGMQGADRAVFAEYSWTDENNTQCEKRISRKGRDSRLPVRADYIVLPNSLDEIVLKSCFRKENQTRKVFGK